MSIPQGRRDTVTRHDGVYIIDTWERRGEHGNSSFHTSVHRYDQVAEPHAFASDPETGRLGFATYRTPFEALQGHLDATSDVTRGHYDLHDLRDQASGDDAHPLHKKGSS
jgi:hypothetical protein